MQNNKKKSKDVNGILVVDKPSGLTSHDVVDCIRGWFRIKKAGHAGTLDPMTTGVLVILIGKATKASGLLTNQDKEYEATMTLGVETDTEDKEGKVVATKDWSGITEEKLQKAFDKFKGQIKQVPPMVSAKRFKGKRLYDLKRAGIEVEREPREIEIKKLEITNIGLPEVTFRLNCSKGTYVRQLCADIGKELGCGAHASWMRRTRSGDFKIEESVGLESLRNLPREDFEKSLNKSYENYTRDKKDKKV